MDNQLNYSDFIIYGDETGDPAMQPTYKEHPIFALVLCIFAKSDYMIHATQHMKNLKFAFWGHDAVVLHSAKLRKQIEAFQFLQNPEQRISFLNALTVTIQNAPFTIISTAIDKRLLQQKYAKPENPYELSLTYCIERVYRFLEEKNQTHRVTHILLESRGNHLDAILEIAFHRIIAENSALQLKYPLQLLFVDKKANSIGLQIADLVAYPIGRFVVDPSKENPAFHSFSHKFHKYPNYPGKGLKIFPTPPRIIVPEKRKALELIQGLSAD